MNIVSVLNDYRGPDIWEDVIREIPEYDEAATEEIDPGAASDRFVAGGVIYQYDAATRTWHVAS